MSLLIAFSWPYSDQPHEQSRFFFDSVKQNIISYPFQGQKNEIALVKSWNGFYSACFLVHTDYQGDDSVAILEAINNWFKTINSPNYQDYESVPLKGNSIKDSLGTGYEILESIKEFGKPKKTKKKSEQKEKKILFLEPKKMNQDSKNKNTISWDSAISLLNQSNDSEET
ncbi:MAG: hypothetical protein JXB49_10765 [Bacteroidales bacterium]|nr:hypothetical protein [Bacteroidales bacterium]